MSTLGDSLLGKQLDEYRIDKPLGTGGMARVYRALDTKLQRYVALKVVAPYLRADEEHTRRFEREAQSVARLQHPNIVQIHRFGEADGLYYIAMQYVGGADLGQIIADYKVDGEVMRLNDVVRIVEEIGSALDYAHSKNVIHRDVKPRNIMLDYDGRAILTDFGLALLSDLGTQGEVFGSPHYISPEQAISSGNVVPQSDLYALGVVLFEMLTGDVPFEAIDPMDVAMRHVSDPPPRPSDLNQAVPPQIDEVVLRCLEKEPDDRYQTGADLSAALQHAVIASQEFQVPTQGSLRRPSLVLVPTKVHDIAQASPLPPLPPASPAAVEPEQLSSLTGQTTRPAILPETRPTAMPTPAGQTRHVWRAPLIVAATIFFCGLVVLIGFFVVSRGSSSTEISSAATLTATPPSTDAQFTLTPEPTSTATTTQPPTAVVSEVTATPVVLPPTSAPLPTAMIIAPTATAVILAPTAVPPQIAMPPADRSVAPPGSRRLGEFAVEQYCNQQGYGIILTNNQTDWACTNSNGSIAFILQPTDFDNICRARYNNPGAFAVRDQTKPVQAYNWSCYEYQVAPTATAAVATPSIATLRIEKSQDWVAFINISSTTLSLSEFRLEREGRTLDANAWGRTTLNSRECLRIYKRQQPQALPPNCSTAIDLPETDRDREYWLQGEVEVTVNPNTRYTYKNN